MISVFSFSKVYAMTGWRVGYAVARGQIPDLLRSTQEPQVSCPSTISQKAAEAALTGPREPITAMRDAYAERAALAVETADAGRPPGLCAAGHHLHAARRLRAIGADGGLDFALELLRQQRVSIAPGSVFGPGGDGMVRISLAADEPTIEAGINRIAAHLQQGSK